MMVIDGWVRKSLWRVPQSQVLPGLGELIHRLSDTTTSGSPSERITLHVMDGMGRIAMRETLGGSTVTPVETLRFQLGNHLGTASVAVDGGGNIISYEEYHPYGTTAWQSPELTTVSLKRYRYTGMERDEESGLQRHGMRYYAVWLGRWMSADPIGLGDGVNRYGYCHATPIEISDTDGCEAPPTNTTKITSVGFTPKGLLLVAIDPTKYQLVISGDSLQSIRTAQQQARKTNGLEVGATAVEGTDYDQIIFADTITGRESSVTVGSEQSISLANEKAAEMNRTTNSHRYHPAGTSIILHSHWTSTLPSSTDLYPDGTIKGGDLYVFSMTDPRQLAVSVIISSQTDEVTIVIRGPIRSEKHGRVMVMDIHDPQEAVNALSQAVGSDTPVVILRGHIDPNGSSKGVIVDEIYQPTETP